MRRGLLHRIAESNRRKAFVRQQSAVGSVPPPTDRANSTKPDRPRAGFGQVWP